MSEDHGSGPGSRDLVEAMRAMTTDGGAETGRRLFSVLSRAMLLAPTREPDAGSPDPEAVELVVIEAQDGSPAFLAFTDHEALAAWAGGPVPYLSVSTPQLSRAVLEHPGASLIINSAGRWGGELAASDLEPLAEGLAPMEGSAGGSASFAEVVGGTSMRVLALDEEPLPALVRRLGQLVGEEEDAEECWLFSGAFGAGPVHLMVGIASSTLDPETISALLGRVGEAAAGALPAGVYADVVPLSGELADVVRAVGRRVDAAA